MEYFANKRQEYWARTEDGLLGGGCTGGERKQGKLDKRWADNPFILVRTVKRRLRAKDEEGRTTPKPQDCNLDLCTVSRPFSGGKHHWTRGDEEHLKIQTRRMWQIERRERKEFASDEILKRCPTQNNPNPIKVTSPLGGYFGCCCCRRRRLASVDENKRII